MDLSRIPTPIRRIGLAMIFTKQQYMEAPPISLSYVAKAGMSYEDLYGFCLKCNQPVQDLRGFVVEHVNCVEARFAGVCHQCKLITSFHLRLYPNGKMLFYKDNQWNEHDNKTWYSRLINKFYNFYLTLCRYCAMLPL